MSAEYLLSIEASSAVCSMAACGPGGMASASAEQSGNHAGDLMALLEQVLGTAQLAPEDLTGIVYGCGPGSFTGVRIGVALAQGLAHAAELPMLPVSSLRNVAQQFFDATPDACEVEVAIDARMGEWYVGRCDRSANDLAIPVGAERLVDPEIWLANGDRQTPTIVTAKAIDDSHRAAAQARGSALRVVPMVPAANVALALARSAPEAEWHGPEAAAASYIRNKVAQTIAERESR